MKTQPYSMMFYENTLIRKTSISLWSIKSSAKTCNLLLLHMVLWHPARAGVPLPSLKPPQPLQPQQEPSASAGPATTLPLHTNATGEDIPVSWGTLHLGNPARPQQFTDDTSFVTAIMFPAATRPLSWPPSSKQMVVVIARGQGVILKALVTSY